VLPENAVARRLYARLGFRESPCLLMTNRRR
jgi:predicted GNAT family acetyltransferase